MDQQQTTMRVNSPLYLDYRFRPRFNLMLSHPKILQHKFRLFETFRSDEEQLRVFNLGTSKAKPPHSPHNWGLAADFVPYGDEGWHWPNTNWEGWAELRKVAAEVNLECHIQWDRPHVEVPEWEAIKSHRTRDEIIKLYQQRHKKW